MVGKRYWMVALVVLSLAGGEIGWADPTPIMRPHVQRVSKDATLSFERIVAPHFQVCGGIAGIPCASLNEFCKFPVGTCDVIDNQGVCTPIPNGCPEYYDPVCGCDGVTYGNECEADAAAVSIDYWGPCRQICGGLVWIPCEDPNEFCKFPVGTCDWADHFGECTPIPEGCPDVWDPVCGCDGVTYGNECESDMAEMSLDHYGECEQICGGIMGIPCDDFDEFCKYPVGTCDVIDNQGVCTPIPSGCPDVWDPVCGCDGITYGNECEADAAAMSIDHWGPCSQVCGGFMGIPCENLREFCKYPIGTCEWSDYFGECTPIPGDCPEYYDPVCGCDGVTYDNECFAYAASMSLESWGPCRASHTCFTGTPCEGPDQFCKYPAGTCDLTNNEGVCIPIQTGCPRVWEPVCGCNGNTYSNECEADAAATSVDYSGICR